VASSGRVASFRNYDGRAVRPKRRASLVVAALLAAGLSSGLLAMLAASADARTSYLSGRLSVPGYTVAVVGYNGKAVFSRRRSFRVRAPDLKVTVQLVDTHGRYGGPVVFGGSASRAIVGVKAGTNLGAILVVPASGYAHVSHKLAASRLDTGRWAYAKRGVPIGNGHNFGLVTSATKGSAQGAGADPAHIGVPNEFNIALPGTRVLKALAPAKRTTARAKTKAPTDTKELRYGPMAAVADVCPPPPNAAPPGCTPPQPGPPSPNGPTGPTGPGLAQTQLSPWMAQMFLPMDQTVNADVAGVTRAELDANLQANLNLVLLNIPSAGRVELNCNGLSFCAKGGTGQARLEALPNPDGVPGLTPFPSSSLDAATGFGELIGPDVPTGLLGGHANGGHEFSLDPHATTAQIGSGDVITELVTDHGLTTQIPTTIGFVFSTVPAITAYTDSAANSANITYPDTTALGTVDNPLKVAAGPNGDVVMTFTVLRPQRTGVPGAGEPAFMDIGNLGYMLDYVPAPAPGASPSPGSSEGPGCATASYSNPSSKLTIKGPGTGVGGIGPTTGQSWLVDSAADQRASATNTISFSVDLTRCLADKGTASFPVGQPVEFDLSANSQSSHDHVNQSFAVERVS
jgi:hypothetical protein